MQESRHAAAMTATSAVRSAVWRGLGLADAAGALSRGFIAAFILPTRALKRSYDSSVAGCSGMGDLRSSSSR